MTWQSDKTAQCGEKGATEAPVKRGGAGNRARSGQMQHKNAPNTAGRMRQQKMTWGRLSVQLLWLL